MFFFPCVSLAEQLTNEALRTAVATLTEDGTSPTYGHISDWDVSQVTNMADLFSGALALKHLKILRNF